MKMTLDDVLRIQGKTDKVRQLRLLVDDELESEQKRSEARQDLAAITSRASIELARRNSKPVGKDKYTFIRGARVRLA